MFFKSLRARVSFNSIFCLVTLGASLGGYVIYNEKKSQMDALKKVMHSTAKVMIPQAAYALTQKDPVILSQTIYSLERKGGFSYAEVIDAEGAVIVPIRPGAVKKCRPNLRGEWQSNNEEYLSFMRETTYDDLGQIYEAVFRIENQNRILGFVAVGINTQPVYREMWKNIFSLLALISLLVSIVTAASLMLSRKATDSVLQLSSAVSNLFNKIGSLTHDDLRPLAVRDAPSEVESLSMIVHKTFSQIINQEDILSAKLEELKKSQEGAQEELQTLLDAYRGIGQYLKMDQLVRALLVKARSVVHANFYGVVLAVKMDAEGIPMIDPKSKLDDETLHTYTLDSTMNFVKLINGNAMRRMFSKDSISFEHIPNIRQSEYAKEIHSSFKSCSMFPLFTLDRLPIGVLFLGKFGEGPFDERKLQLLAAVMESVKSQLEKVILYATVEKMAKYDGLTGLLNHRHIRAKLDEEFRRCKRREESMYLAGLDIDHFKQINDNYGHENGDAVLREFSKILSSSCIRREGEFVGRDGGEEFFIVLGNNTSKDEALNIVRKIQSDVRETAVRGLRGETIKFTVSIGVAGFPRDSQSMEDLREKTDRALYAAKSNGRDRIIFWEDSLERLSVVQ